MKQIDMHAADGGAISLDDATEWDTKSQHQPLLAQIIGIAQRRKWELIGAIVAALALGLIVTFLMTPQYTSSSLVEIQRDDQSITDVDSSTPKAAFVSQEFYETQYGLLRSTSLANRVATDLRLYDDPHFFEIFKIRRAASWFTNGRVNRAAIAREDRIKLAGSLLLSRLTVEPQRLSQLVEISFTSPDPQLSKRVADAWGRNFVRSTIERRFDATSYARRYLEQRLAQLRTKLDESEQLVVDYATREGIVNLPGTPGGPGQQATPERSLLVESLGRLNQELGSATADRIRAESRIASSGNVTEVLDNNAIGSLREKRAEVAADYARMMVQFEPDYPPAKALASQLAQLDRSIAREESRVGSTLRETYAASIKREGDLQRGVNDLRDQVLNLRRRSIQYNIYQRDVDTNRELYDALLQRYKAIGVAGQVGATNISIVDAAELPVIPSSPRLLINMLIALAAGVVAGIALGVAREQLDQAVSDPATIEDLLGVPLLGTTPHTREAPERDLADPKSALAEAYLSLRTNLGFATDHGVPRTIAVTSSRPAEGKSTTSYALALSLARAGRRVLLVDADMRSPSMHHIVGATNEAGLSNYLSGNAEIDTLIRPTGMDGLQAVFAGPTPPSAPELLAGDRFGMLLDTLLTRFDHVLFDCPPVMGLADAPIICSRVEGTIFVVEAHATHRNLARGAISRLLKANTTLIGVVATKFNSKRTQYGYGNSYGYSYSYGERTA